MPVSAEQAEGPKKVKVVLLPSAMAVSAFPHTVHLSDLNFHCGNVLPWMLLHAWHTGTIGGGGGGIIIAVSAGGGMAPPSKLYSLAQPEKVTIKKISMGSSAAIIMLKLPFFIYPAYKGSSARLCRPGTCKMKA